MEGLWDHSPYCEHDDCESLAGLTEEMIVEGDHHLPNRSVAKAFA